MELQDSQHIVLQGGKKDIRVNENITKVSFIPIKYSIKDESLFKMKLVLSLI
jgi:hypothetical protein